MEIQSFDKFEYMMPKLSGYSSTKIIDELNKLGAQGWELISNITDNIGRHQYIMKRKMSS